MLKSAFYEAEHVLGLVEYQRLEKEVNSLFPSTSKFNFKNIKAKLPKISSEKKNLIESLENLEKVVTEGMKFVSLLNLPSNGVNKLTWRSNEQDTETISTPDSTVIGRDQDRDYIVKLLREDLPESSNNESCYSVIGIWGIGGSGKTTLAQYVCDFERKKIEENNDKYFDCVIWAHVSQQFCVHVIWQKIWDSAFKDPCPTSSSHEGLRSKLEEKLRGQRVFLVLDDVWCDKGVSVQQVGKLFSPLKGCKRGSKVLVTTRIDEAAKVMGAMNPIPLRELDEDQFFSLFTSNAVDDAQIRDKQLNNKIKLIGKEIATKLRGSPLAAKIVAAQLRRKLDTEYWSSMLNRNLLNDTMGALFLSYQHLRLPLQRCFAFCSLFPKGHLFWRHNLVNLWIAEGFIETEDSEHINDTATRYILELVSCSFFQVDKITSYCYSMHDLMHDLAERVSQTECFKIQSGEEKEIPTQTRHLWVVGDMIGEYVEKICKLKDLCTIVVSGWNLKEVDLEAIFTNLRKLRVVDLNHIESLPKSVIHLKNLRYLKIIQVDAIPDSVLESLNRLYQLRVLFIGEKHGSIEIPDVGRLVLLKDLREFHVRKKRGFELKQLEHFTDFSGSLSIYGLHNVETKEEARQAKLSEKRSLRNLSFYWDNSENVLRDSDVEILDGLSPPPQIKELFIKGYSGKRFPNWILESNDNIIHLKRLELADCNGLEALTGIDKLSDLQSITICRLPRLKSWVPPPINLTELEIIYCPSLAFAVKEDLETIISVAFSNHECDYYCTTDVCQFKRAQEIIIKLDGEKEEQALSTIPNDLKNCLEKTTVGEFKDIYSELYLPVALEDLSIESCIITDRVLARSLQGLNSLTKLKLESITEITCIADEVLCSLTSLKHLKIRDCLLLTSIGGWNM